MSWKEATTVSQREAFITQARQEGRNMTQLCTAYGISRKTGYKWLRRYHEQGVTGLRDQSRRPHHSPQRTAAAVEQLILQAREQHPVWGGRKLKRWLERRGYSNVPAPSTISAILRRHDRLDAGEARKHRAYQRFEMAAPNDLWQMDFKGYFQVGTNQTCHPLTVLDDHSRYLLGLQACANEQTATVQGHLTSLFRRYGLPERMLMDNGSPWGDAADSPYTRLTVWLLRLGIRISHGRPYHPQTQGKDERLHRTLQAEVLRDSVLPDLPACQRVFDRWRVLYNLERPHEALDLDVPDSRYQPSPRPFPETLPPLIYPPGDAVRKVDASGKISFRNRSLRVGKAFIGQLVGVRADPLTDGLFHLNFNQIRIRTYDFTRLS